MEIPEIGCRIGTFLITPNYLSMERSPFWEANRFAATQEIPRIFWNSKVHHRIHKCPPPVSILSQLNPAHTLTSHFLKISLNIVLSSTPWSPQWSLFLRFFSPKPYARLFPYALHARPSRSSLFNHPHNSGWGLQIIKLLIWSFFHSPVSSSLLGPNTLLNTLFSNTLNTNTKLK
jgi:hypothetical protein